MKKVVIVFIILLFVNSAMSYESTRTVNTQDLIKLIDQSRGKVLILMFWSLWCPLCVKELEILEKIKNTYSPQKIKIVSVCIDKNSRKIKKFLNKKDISLPVLIGKEDVRISFNIVGVPKIYIFDKNSNAVKWQMGYIEESLLIKIINDLI